MSSSRGAGPGDAPGPGSTHDETTHEPSEDTMDPHETPEDRVGTADPDPAPPVTGAPPRDDTSDDAGRPTPGATAVGPVVDRSVRVGTVVWGLVLAAVGLGLLAIAAGIDFDVELAFILLVAAAGAALLVGSAVTAVRRRGH